MNQIELFTHLGNYLAIETVDSRGYFISHDIGNGIMGGMYYLHKDGSIQTGVGDGFWPTHKEAFDFWTESYHNVMNPVQTRIKL